jgi:hypothetical protein
MATKMLVCPECASAVAPGRFACTSCGALLASVASTPRSLGWIDSTPSPIVTAAAPLDDSADQVTIDPDAIDPAGGGRAIGPAWAHGPRERAPGETDLSLAVDDDAPLAAFVESAVGLEPIGAAEKASKAESLGDLEAQAPGAVLDPITNTEAALDVEPAAEIEPVPGAEAVVDPDSGGDAVRPRDRAPEPNWPETRGWPPAGAEHLPSAPEPAPRPRAGAYLPPSAVLMTVGELPLGPTNGGPAGRVSGASSAAATSPADAVAVTAKRELPRLPDLDPTIPPNLVAIGAGIAGLGFLLPWAAIVIGSGRIGGYLEQWGLAGPGHPILLLAVAALGAAASLIDRLPAWARPGLPAVILAGLLVGLVWPYLFGGLQPSVGVYLTLGGALVLIVGGLLDLRAVRHAEGSRAV